MKVRNKKAFNEINLFFSNKFVSEYISKSFEKSDLLWEAS
jgi:hypothetical protein